MALGQVSLEFEFVDDPSGGSFTVSAGNLSSVLSNACATGDLQMAVRLYEDHGASLGDELLATFASASSATRENAAKMFARARDFGRAARMMVTCRDYPAAAGFFEQAFDFVAAGKCHQACGDSVHAAAAFDRGGQVDLAMRLYEAAGAKDDMADCLVRHGRAMEGADLYRSLGNMRGEVEALRQVSLDDPSRPVAARRLASLYERFHRDAEATQLLVETLRQCPAARGDTDLFVQLTALFDRQGKPDQAQKARAHLASLGATAPAPAAPQAAPVQSEPSGATEYELLKAIPIFAELSIDDMKDLYRVAQETPFAPGAALVELDVEPPGLMVLVEGKAEVFAGAGPQARKLNELATGDYLGEISLIQGGRTSARVVATTPVRALTISRDHFEHYLYAHESAAMRIFRLFAKNLAERVRALSVAR